MNLTDPKLLNNTQCGTELVKCIYIFLSYCSTQWSNVMGQSNDKKKYITTVPLK